MNIRKLNQTDNLSGFDAADQDLNRFFLNHAKTNQFEHFIGTTYVAVESNTILGFLTVCPSSIEFEKISDHFKKKLPKYPLPVIRLARMASDKNFRGVGVGKALLEYCFYLSEALAKSSGCVGVLVDSKAAAVSFYTKFGFREIKIIEGSLGDRPEPKTLFLDIHTILAAKEG